MAYNRDNVFAKVLRGELPCDKVFENGSAVVIRNLYPAAKLHLLVLPKGEYADFAAFAEASTDEERRDFRAAVLHVIGEFGLADAGYRIVVNSGEDGGQSIPHFHMHILGGEKLDAHGL